MSRSGYDDCVDDQWQIIRWRGAVASAIRGARGQAFLKEMLSALEALPERKLIAHELEQDGAVCAIGAVGKIRDVNMAGVDPTESEQVAALFGIPHALTCEITYMNDEGRYRETPEERFARMQQWIAGMIRKPQPLWFWSR